MLYCFSLAGMVELGRHESLKSFWEKSRPGSSPGTRTKGLKLRACEQILLYTICMNGKGTNTCSECGGFKKEKRTTFCSYTCSNKNHGAARKRHAAYSDRRAVCDTCDQEKASCNFSLTEKWNSSSPRKTTCKSCSARIREQKRRDRSWKDDAITCMLSNAKRRAKNAGIEFNLKREDINIPDVCPVFGFPLERTKSNNWTTSPSIDRFDNTRGYVPDNIVIVSRRANILKNDATVEELRLLANWAESEQQKHCN